MSDWERVKLGTNITGFEGGGSLYDNYEVVGLGVDWAVLRSKGGSNVCEMVLEPTDRYEIGYHGFDGSNCGLVLIEETYDA